MLPIRHILVAVDFSDLSNQALTLGRTIADCCGAALHLVHVIPVALAEPPVPQGEHSEACRRLDALLDDADRRIRHATTACLVGPTAPALTAYATGHDIDLVVMGTHAHDPSFQMVRGSIAERVLSTVPCAVLAVKDG